MLIRAFIILLICLNLGVAAWWLMARTSTPAAADIHVGQAPLLSIATDEQIKAAKRPVAAVAIAPKTSPKPSTPAVEALPTPPPQLPPSPPSIVSLTCVALGPFANEEAARGARAKLKPAPSSELLRSQRKTELAYSVVAPTKDIPAARLLAQRIALAGINDMFVVTTGSPGVALGRYSRREGAMSRLNQLQAAGFNVHMETVEVDNPESWWLDVCSSAKASVLKTQTGAQQVIAQRAASTPSPQSPAPNLACIALGPFDDEAAAREAGVKLRPDVETASLRSQRQTEESYSVVVPTKDIPAARALVQKITAAGISDMFVITTGSPGVALGHYSKREGALSRLSELKAAGFEARLDAVQSQGPVSWWLDVQSNAETSLLQKKSGAKNVIKQDCSRISG